MCSTKTMSWIMIPLILGFFAGAILVGVQVDVSTELVTINPDGAEGTALVIYHPGKSNFQEDVTTAFVDGLVSAGWRCEVTTASREAPASVDGYDLLVLGAPTYQLRPATPITRFLRRAGDLEGTATALVITAAGSSSAAAEHLQTVVEDANGQVIRSLELWSLAPNGEMHGIADPIEIATRAGAAVPAP